MQVAGCESRAAALTADEVPLVSAVLKGARAALDAAEVLVADHAVQEPWSYLYRLVAVETMEAGHVE